MNFYIMGLIALVSHTHTHMETFTHSDAFVVCEQSIAAVPSECKHRAEPPYITFEKSSLDHPAQETSSELDRPMLTMSVGSLAG